jgi:hypothetical protein
MYDNLNSTKLMTDQIDEDFETITGFLYGLIFCIPFWLILFSMVF